MQIARRPNDGSVDDRLGRIMYDAIHHGSLVYTPAERHAWLPRPNAGPAWAARLAAQRVWVGYLDGTAQGFITLDGSYVDLAFVAARAQGQGLFRALYGALEAATAEPHLWTHASLTAQPAFLAMGFRVICEEKIARGSETLRRAKMERVLE